MMLLLLAIHLLNLLLYCMNSYDIWQTKSVSLHFCGIFDSIENYPVFMSFRFDLELFHLSVPPLALTRSFFLSVSSNAIA